MKQTHSFVYFWGKQDAFSNWHPSEFTYLGILFSHVEMFMMYSKAMLFGDAETAKQILATPDPKSCKDLGRSVKGFVEETWGKKCQQIVEIGCREKFLQNPSLLEQLLNTDGRLLVEASPYDRIWGIGLSADNPRASTPSTWQGRNLLGHILTKIRDQLLEGYEAQTIPDRALLAMAYAMTNPGQQQGVI
jgi:hypothetical protein